MNEAYDTIPSALQEIVTLLLMSYSEPSESECVATAFAVAEFPLLEEEHFFIDHDVAFDMVL